jgi:hypothetical protein
MKARNLIEPPIPVPGKSQAETDFERQKRLFLGIPLTDRERYRGRFVVSRDGVIVDDDADLVELTHRFFGHHGKVPVYITRIGKPIRMPSPFVR